VVLDRSSALQTDASAETANFRFADGLHLTGFGNRAFTKDVVELPMFTGTPSVGATPDPAIGTGNGTTGHAIKATGGPTMKHVLLAAMAAALLVTPVLVSPAAAQMGGKRGADHAPAPAAAKIDEKAYKAALERIPDAKEKYDPWGGVAPAATAAPAKKK
jgi:hypothetical protein